MSEEDKKRPIDSEEPEPKRARCDKTETEPLSPEERLKQTKRQIEYYMSDDNLKHDAFFQKIIQADSEGWMPFTTLLSCKRIQQLGVNCAEIMEALKGSESVEVKADEGDSAENKFIRRRDNKPLPALEERQPRKAANSKFGKRSDDHHVAGCLIRIENVPEEASWEAVKSALSTRLPEPVAKPQTPEEIAAGKKPFIEYPIRFVGTPNSNGVCNAHLAPFENDQSVIATWNEEPLKINGQEVKIALITEYEEAMNFVKSMPTVLQKRRERDIARKKQELNSKPIVIAGSRFASIDHLKKCLKEVMMDLPAGKMVNLKTSEVLKGLLQYHPNGAKKLENSKGFKVDVAEKATKSGDTTRCFYVVKEDDSCEDFSLQKCFTFLTRNPPFATEESTAPCSQETEAKEEAVPTAAV